MHYRKEIKFYAFGPNAIWRVCPFKKMQIILTYFLFNIYTLGRLSRKENNERTALCLPFFSNILEHIFLVVNKLSPYLRIENYCINAECKLELIYSSDPRTSYFSLHGWKIVTFSRPSAGLWITYDLILFLYMAGKHTFSGTSLRQGCCSFMSSNLLR